MATGVVASYEDWLGSAPGRTDMAGYNRYLVNMGQQPISTGGGTSTSSGGMSPAQRNNQIVANAIENYRATVNRYNASMPSGHYMLQPYKDSMIGASGFNINTPLSQLLSAQSQASTNLAGLNSLSTMTLGAPPPTLSDTVTIYSEKGNPFTTNIWSYSNQQAPQFAPLTDLSERTAPLISQQQGALNTINDLVSQRQTAEDAFYNFQSDVRGQTGSLLGNTYGASIADEDLLTQYQSQTQALRDKIAGFKSPITDPSFIDFSYSLGNLNNAGTRIADLLTERQDELARIQGFQNDMSSSLTGYEDLFSGLTIADEAAMEGLQGDLRNAQRQLGSFNSLLSDEYDLSPYFGQVEDLNYGLNDLMAERRDELSRIEGEESRLRGVDDSIRRNLQRLGTTRLADIEELQYQIDQGETDIAGFSSLLPFDFNTYDTNFDNYADTLSQISNQRQTELDEFNDLLGGFNTQFGDMELWQERDMQSLQRELARQYGELAMYEGGRAPGLQGQFDDLGVGIGNRLDELYNYRDELERDAIGRIDTLGRGFASMEDLYAFRDELTPFRELLSQYGATQADDEMRQIDMLYKEEEARLAAELADKRKREEEEAAAFLQNSVFYNQSRALTPEEYGGLMANQRNRTRNYISPTLLSSLIQNGAV
jgi:hypothetical protein